MSHPPLLSLPLEMMGSGERDPHWEYDFERFLKSRDVILGQPTTHRKPFASVQVSLLIEVIGKRRPWDRRILRRAWRDILSVEPTQSKLSDAALRRRLRRRWPGRLDSPWLHWPLLHLRARCCEEARRFPEAFTPVSRAFLDYALLALLTAKP